MLEIKTPLQPNVQDLIRLRADVVQHSRRRPPSSISIAEQMRSCSPTKWREWWENSVRVAGSLHLVCYGSPRSLVRLLTVEHCYTLPSRVRPEDGRAER